MRGWLEPVLPGSHLISPDAPTPAALGGRGYEWFALTGDPGAMSARAAQAAHRLAATLRTRQRAAAVGPERTAVVGFSQGATVASCLVGCGLATTFVLANGLPVPPAGADVVAGTRILV